MGALGDRFTGLLRVWGLATTRTGLTACAALSSDSENALQQYQADHSCATLAVTVKTRRQTLCDSTSRPSPWPVP